MTNHKKQINTKSQAPNKHQIQNINYPHIENGDRWLEALLIII